MHNTNFINVKAELKVYLTMKIINKQREAGKSNYQRG